VNGLHGASEGWPPSVLTAHRALKSPVVAVVRLRDGKLAHEHVYWDQASVLVQLGLIDAASPPVAGVENARKGLDPQLPSNQLMRR
jgi:carboxymethylenebutenolidase